jgi:hypothetical protein
MFTDEEKQQIKLVVSEAMEERRQRFRSEEKPPEKETKLYLITLVGHQIGFPEYGEGAGRTIMNQVFYARVEVTKDHPSFYGGLVEVLAYGDGRLLKQPHKVVLQGGTVSAMVEVSENVFLERDKANAAG